MSDLSVAEAVFYSITVLCGSFLLYRGIECLRANTAAGLRAMDRSRRDELHQIERLIEKFQFKDNPVVVQQHASERANQVVSDATVERSASERPSPPKKKSNTLVSTDVYPTEGDGGAPCI